MFFVMKILVTGGSGYIGRYIVKELEENGYEVGILSRKEKNAVKGDVRNINSLIKAFRGYDAVFHNAALAMDWGKKKEFYETNVEGTKNVAKACLENGIERIVYTSSAGGYGFPNSMEPIKENAPKKPLNAYQKSKWMGEQVLKKFDLKVSIIRPPLVLGGNGKATQILISSIKNGTFSYIGDGNNFITIVHPADVAKGARLAFEKDKKGEAFNIASFSCRIKEMVEKIASKLGVKVEKHVSYHAAYFYAMLSEFFGSIKGREPAITRFRVKSLATNRIISFEKAKKKLGYKPSYNLEKLIDDMLQ